MNELVRGYTVATIEEATGQNELGTLRHGVSTFATALRNSAPLRDALSDPGLGIVARSGIVTDLLSNGAAPNLSGLLQFGVRAARPGEFAALVTSLEELVESSTEMPSDNKAEPPASRVVARERIRGYAERVMQALPPSEIDEVEDELFRFSRTVDGSKELRRTLVDANLSLSARIGVVSELLASAHVTTRRLVTYVLRAGRLRDLVGVLSWLVELAAEERGRRVGEVRSAVDLEENEVTEIKSVLSSLLGREVEVRVINDPTVIGGLRISVGELVIDGTVRLRLDRLRDLLSQTA